MITRKSFVHLAMVAAGGLSLSACATTEYVDEQIALVNARVDGVEANLATTTSTANAAAADAQNANRRLDQLTGRVDRLEQAAAAQRRPRN